MIFIHLIQLCLRQRGLKRLWQQISLNSLLNCIFFNAIKIDHGNIYLLQYLIHFYFFVSKSIGRDQFYELTNFRLLIPPQLLLFVFPDKLVGFKFLVEQSFQIFLDRTCVLIKSFFNRINLIWDCCIYLSIVIINELFLFHICFAVLFNNRCSLCVSDSYVATMLVFVI